MIPVRENGESPGQSHSQHLPGDRSVPVGRRWQRHLGHLPVPPGTGALLGTPWPAASPPGWCSHWHSSAQLCRAGRRLSPAPGMGKDAGVTAGALNNPSAPVASPGEAQTRGWECSQFCKTFPVVLRNGTGNTKIPISELPPGSDSSQGAAQSPQPAERKPVLHRSALSCLWIIHTNPEQGIQHPLPAGAGEIQTNSLIFPCYTQLQVQTRNDLGLFATYKSPFVIYLLSSLSGGFQW